MRDKLTGAGDKDKMQKLSGVILEHREANKPAQEVFSLDGSITSVDIISSNGTTLDGVIAIFIDMIAQRIQRYGRSCFQGNDDNREISKRRLSCLPMRAGLTPNPLLS